MNISEMKKGYMILGLTGCTCSSCDEEHFIDGIFDTEEAGIDRLAYHESRCTIRSQYSNTGIYTLYEIEYEQLLDGRIIFQDRVFESSSIYDQGRHIDNLSWYGTKIILTAGSYLKN